jgi:phage tail-like protein
MANERELGPSTHKSGYGALDYEFELEVEGKLTGVFQSLVGGDIEVARIQHDIVYESGLSTTLFIPGATSFQPFTMYRGFGNYVELYTWLMEASNGRIIQARRSGSVKMRRRGHLMFQWDFDNAWPTKLSNFAVNPYQGATKARVAVTIAAESIELVDVDYEPLTPPDPKDYFKDLFGTP